MAEEDEETSYRPGRTLRPELARQVREGKVQTEADRLNALAPDVPWLAPEDLR